MKFTILGNVCIDHNKSEKIFYKAAGGPITFMSIVLKQLPDSYVKAISSYGSDFIYKKNLSLYPYKPNVKKTLLYENIIKNGKRTQKCYFYQDNLPVRIDKHIRNIVLNTDVLFITPLLPNYSPSYLKKLTGCTQKSCLKILLPQGYFRKFNKIGEVKFRGFAEANLVLPLIDIVILSYEDCPDIEEVSFRWVKKFEVTVIITRAEKGAIIISKGGKNVVTTKPVPRKNIVDSVGAGDIFGAGFGYYYLQTKDFIKSVKLANMIARQCLYYRSKNIIIKKIRKDCFSK